MIESEASLDYQPTVRPRQSKPVDDNEETTAVTPERPQLEPDDTPGPAATTGLSMESHVVTDDQQCWLLLFCHSIVEVLVSDANQVATKTRLLHSSNKLHCYRADCTYLYASRS